MAQLINTGYSFPTYEPSYGYHGAITSAPDWSSITPSDTPILVDLLEPLTNSTVLQIQEEIFKPLVPDHWQGWATGKASFFQRGLQILSRYKLDALVHLYWPETEDVFSQRGHIEGIASIGDLLKNTGNFLDTKLKLQRFYEVTTIPHSVPRLALGATSGHGDMEPILSCLLLYFCLIGEAKRRGDTST